MTRLTRRDNGWSRSTTPPETKVRVQAADARKVFKAVAPLPESKMIGRTLALAALSFTLATPVWRGICFGFL